MSSGPESGIAGRRLLLVAPYASYRTAPFIDAARRLRVDLLLLSSNSGGSFPTGVAGASFDPSKPGDAERLAFELHRRQPFDGVCGTDDSTVETASRIGAKLGLRANPPGAVALTRDKLAARRVTAAAGIAVPGYVSLPAHMSPDRLSSMPPFPVVVKPLALSASRGVIRVDCPTRLPAAIGRVRRLLAEEGVPDSAILIESYVPGFEVAVEAILVDGRLHPLAVFDKPDPLVGPYFEETYYITPSRLPVARLDEMLRLLAAVCRALGLVQGPVHAEFRFNEQGIWPIEVAARTIGGRCAQLLSTGSGRTLEELVVMQALGAMPPEVRRSKARGVLMVPVPASGVVRRVEGIGEARRVAGIERVEIDVSTGQMLSAWPEGGAYPGFVFSSGVTPLDAERALREAAALLRIVVAPLLATGAIGNQGKM